MAEAGERDADGGLVAGDPEDDVAARLGQLADAPGERGLADPGLAEQHDAAQAGGTEARQHLLRQLVPSDDGPVLHGPDDIRVGQPPFGVTRNLSPVAILA